LFNFVLNVLLMVGGRLTTVIDADVSVVWSTVIEKARLLEYMFAIVQMRIGIDYALVSEVWIL
jgi:hypothetical protein